MVTEEVTQTPGQTLSPFWSINTKGDPEMS